jgi:uncharacterized Ntn-hydrolase superfamily protein
MAKHLMIVALAWVFALPLWVQAAAPGGPLAHTFSIVARDPRTGEMGVAVQSHWFGVGTIVAWAEAGVGAVATQSFVEPAYGPRGLELMRSGLAAPDALKALVAADPAEAVRQVAFVDAGGRVATHTGARCIAWAGHLAGAQFSVQANMMLNDRVVPAMRRAFESSSGPLAERLVGALEAAEAAGGDIRGRQAAAVLVVRGQSTGRPWADRLVDLRVEDHPDPVPELKRLLAVHRAYERMNAGDLAVEKNDLAAALEHYSAAARLQPGNLEMRFWTAVTLATNNRLEGALPIFREVFSQDKNWAELLRRLPAAGIVPDTPEGRALVDQILRETGQ